MDQPNAPFFAKDEIILLLWGILQAHLVWGTREQREGNHDDEVANEPGARTKLRRSLFDFQTIEIRPIRVVLIEEPGGERETMESAISRAKGTLGIPVKSGTRNKLHFCECSSLLSFDLSTRSPMKSCLITKRCSEEQRVERSEGRDDHTRYPVTIPRYIPPIHRTPQLTAKKKKSRSKAALRYLRWYARLFMAVAMSNKCQHDGCSLICYNFRPKHCSTKRPSYLSINSFRTIVLWTMDAITQYWVAQGFYVFRWETNASAREEDLASRSWVSNQFRSFHWPKNLSTAAHTVLSVQCNLYYLWDY